MLKHKKTNKTTNSNNVIENPNEMLDKISNAIFNFTPNYNQHLEMEAKFNTTKLSKIDYNNVIKKIISLGWKPKNDVNGEYYLKIQQTYASNLGITDNAEYNQNRIEIQGIHNIQEYCKTDNIQSIEKYNSSSITIIRKKPEMYKIPNTERMNKLMANFTDFQFKVSLNMETTINKDSNECKKIYDNWNEYKKIFRYMNRVSFIHDNYPFQIDLSIVKSSSTINNNLYKLKETYSIKDSNVFNNKETYEIEIETINHEAKNAQKCGSPSVLSLQLKTVVKHILCGLQQSNYPIGIN